MKQSNILQQILERKRDFLDSQKNLRPLDRLKEEVSQESSRESIFFRSLSQSHPSLITEIKRYSPSKGPLRPELDPLELAMQYAENGAKALSVLTEEDFFRGSIDDIYMIREKLDLPILRKDFIIDEYQLWESKLAKVDAVLLIVAALSDEELYSLSSLAQDLKLEILLEVHNLTEAKQALQLPVSPKIIGVNNRNLQSFEVSLDVSRRLISELKSEDVDLWVSESGLHSKEQIDELCSLGFKAFLIGESLLVSTDPAQKLKSLQAR